MEKTRRKHGKVKTVRNTKGRFITWHKTRPYKWHLTPEQRLERREARRKAKLEIPFFGKHVSIYADNRRWEVIGNGQELYDFIKNIGWYYGPRERFKRINAVDVGPEDVGDLWHEPEIES